MSQCQACGNPGVEVWDICDCGWENDSDLETYDSAGNATLHSVGYVLTKHQRHMWSTANGDTPEAHYQRWITNGRKRIYKWEL